MKLHRCKFCGNLFEPIRASAQFCKSEHRVAYSRNQNPIDSAGQKLQTLSEKAQILANRYRMNSLFETIRSEYNDEALEWVAMAIEHVIMAEMPE